MSADRIEILTKTELDALGKLTVELIRLRQNEVKHLCVENIAPQLYADLCVAYLQAVQVPSPEIKIEIAERAK